MTRKQRFYENAFSRSLSVEQAPKYRYVFNLMRSVAPRRVLDIGAGDGSFIEALRVNLDIPEVMGVEISREAVEMAKKRGLAVCCLDVDETDLPYPNDHFDFIFAGEIIEHLQDPDHLLIEICRVLKKDGVCCLTTPILASWYNRLTLLLGFQPFFTEVSTLYGVGHPIKFWLNAGHLRVFTLRALLELLECHGFVIRKTQGFGINTNLGYGRRFKPVIRILNFFFSPFPGLASDLVVVVNKR